VRVTSLADLATAAGAVQRSGTAIDASAHLASGLGSAWSGRATDEGRVRATLALYDHIQGRVQSLDLRAELLAARGSELLERRRTQAKALLAQASVVDLRPTREYWAEPEASLSIDAFQDNGHTDDLDWEYSVGSAPR
jgi:hypothetical protein